ncbi:MFS transporter [Cellulomonas wangsupingiae]|uniref:MFS transporter n=1 Tax=Cellulomonas wangsupingiae TaxID=2968085 RepID=UPI001D0EFD62|nr:MFS transporter [Cellulomonas wangsupingiae]MCM0638823.1 MFS transporter [Cellulomonas wangsupingiae]
MSELARVRPDLSLTLALAAASFAGGLFLPLSLVYFTVLTDIPLPVLGALVSGSVLVGLPLPLLAGALVDRRGPRPVVVAGLVLHAVAYGGFVVVRDPAPVLVASVVMVAGTRLFWSSVFTLLADHAEAGSALSTEQWFGRLNAARTVGIVAGGLVTGAVVTLDDPDAYVLLAWVAAACTALAAGLVAARVRPPRAVVPADGRAAGLGGMVRDRAFFALLGTNSVFALCILFLGLALPTVVRAGLAGPGWLTSLLLVANALLVAVLSARGAAAAASRPRTAVLRRAGVLWCAAFTVLAVAVSVGLAVAAVLLLVGIVLLSVAEVLHAPASAALVGALGGAARGRYLAVFQYSFVAAELVGPLLFTGLFGVVPALPFAVVAVASLLAAAVLHRSRSLGARSSATP